MIPRKLRLRNYCQLRDITMDFSKGPVFALVAPNGAGKSNLLNGFRAALTGKMSPDAERITDDIYYSANSAIIEGWFDLEAGGSIYVMREFKRKGANSTELTIYNAAGEVLEEIVKSTAANARFEEFLRVNPDTLCQAVIAHQRSIEELLYAPASQRLERFQQFWHGETFETLVDSLDTERKKLYLDTGATERLLNTQALIKTTKDNLISLQTGIADLRKIIDEDRFKAIQAKRNLVDTFSVLKSSHASTTAALLANQTTLQQLSANMAKLSADYPSQIKILNDQLKELISREQLVKSRQVLSTQVNSILQQLTTTQSSLSQKQNQHNDQISTVTVIHWANYITTKTNLETNIKAAEQALKDLELKLKGFTLMVAHKEKRIQDILNPKSGQGLVALKSLLQMLEASKKVAISLQSHAHSTTDSCPACLRKLDTTIDIALLDLTLQTYRDQITPLQKDLETNEAALANLKAQIDPLQQENVKLSNQVQSLNGALTALLPPTTPKPSEDQLNPILSLPKDQLTTWLTSLKLEEAKLTTLATEIVKLENSLTSLQSSLIHYQTELSKSSDVAPVAPNAITQLEQELDLLQKAHIARSELQVNFTQTLGLLQSNQTQLATLEAQRLEKGLPAFNNDIELTITEKEFITSYTELNEKLTSQLTNLQAQTSLLTHYQSLETTQVEAVAKYNDTLRYEAHLKELSRVYKVLPQQIIRSQLKSLCVKIDAIIGLFKLQRPFKLALDDKFGFILQYPSGTSMSIKRASGGERIIMGLAFRLAAHKSLAPEMPFIAIDEPTNHLDEANVQILAALIGQLTSNLKLFGLERMLICTHSDLVAKQANTIISL